MTWPPLADPGITAGVRDALTGGHMALARERDIANWLERRYPGLGAVLGSALEFHRRAAEWAVTGSDEAPPAQGLVIVASGFWTAGESLHARALAARPGTRVVYCDADPRVYEVNTEVLSEPGRVAVMSARAIDPAAVFCEDPPTPARDLLKGGPVSVHLVLTPGRWPPGLAGEAVAGYALALPSGSTVCMSLVLMDEDARGDLLARDSCRSGGTFYAHAREDVRGWVEGAGMALQRGEVEAARAWGRPWLRDYRIARQVPGRAHAAIGIVP